MNHPTTNEKTYEAFVECINCGEQGGLDIPMGTSIGMATCPKCGCKTLEKLDTILEV